MGAGIYLTFMVDITGEAVSLLTEIQSGYGMSVPLVPTPWDLCWQPSVSLCGLWVSSIMAVPIFYVVMVLKRKTFFFSCDWFPC